MKISELPKLSEVRRDIEIPLAVQEENYSITMGQIIDAISQSIVPFEKILARSEYVQFGSGTPDADVGNVIFDIQNNKFYLADSTTSDVVGQTVTVWTYFQNWNTHDYYYDDDGNVRQDCLFRSTDGRLYFFDGETLKSAGITDEQAKQIRHANPIEVASEEEMQQRIAAGEYEDGQLYFLAEE